MMGGETAWMVLMNLSLAHSASAHWECSSAMMATAPTHTPYAICVRIALMGPMKTPCFVVSGITFYILCPLL